MPRTIYIHERSGWPHLRWSGDTLADQLASVRHRQGKLLGRMEALGFPLRQEAALESLAFDALKSSEIEGEKLDIRQIRSSIARKLGIEYGGLPEAADRRVDGVVEMLLDATRNYAQPLTAKRLYGWHAALFPAGYSGLRPIKTGAWRDDKNGPMEVVSGAIGKERVHFVAPAAKRLNDEMRVFLTWLRARPASDPVLEAGLAHFWFVTIHPFEDGNGRIARAIGDLTLARSEASSQRFYSMSTEIRRRRSEYYGILERTQKGPLDLTPWMQWFLECLGSAIDEAETALGSVLLKARFWEQHAAIPFNPRQRDMLLRLLNGFEGKLTTSKWAQLTKCSQDTALRDILELGGLGILERGASGGRSTSYELAPVARQIMRAS